MNNEKLQRYSLVAEILGGLAVILSIIYLAVEIQSNTHAIQTQSNQGLLELLNELAYMRFENADLMLKGDGNYEELDESERYQYSELFYAGINIYEQAFNSYSSGTLSKELWQAWERECLANQVFYKKPNEEQKYLRIRLSVFPLFRTAYPSLTLR